MLRNSVRYVHSAALILVMCLSSATGQGQDAAKKLLVPANAAQAEATKLIKEIYGDEYSRAKTAAEKQDLAKKLLGKANDSKDDPASQFVLLRLARDIAIQAIDGQTAFQAIDAMAETFQVDGVEMKSVVLTKFTSAAQKPAQHKSIAEESLNLVDGAISQDNFTVAEELGKLALEEARKAREKELIVQAQSRTTEVAELVKAYKDVKAAQVTLEKTPDDPDANLAVGKYLCLVKGDWEKGIPMLALGKDEALKALATQELHGAASSTEQGKLGDGWWDLAEKQEGMAKKRVQGRAGFWYRQALPGLSGLMKDRVEKRLKDVIAEGAKRGTDVTIAASSNTPKSIHFVPGLIVEYFMGHNFDRRITARIAPQINLDWSNTHAEIPQEHFSIRWTGVIIAPKKGRYLFKIDSDDGHRLWLDGKLLADVWTGGRWKRGVKYYSEVMALLDNKPHKICVEYYQDFGAKHLFVKWQAVGNSTDEDIPPTALFHTRGPLDREQTGAKR